MRSEFFCWGCTTNNYLLDKLDVFLDVYNTININTTVANTEYC